MYGGRSSAESTVLSGEVITDRNMSEEYDYANANANKEYEGSYGCVHYNAALDCDGPLPDGMKYTNSVSKLMKSSEAKKEYDEIVDLIEYVDPKQMFTLPGKPHMCRMRKSQRNIDAAEKCEIRKEINRNNYEDATLIIMRYGGVNLSQLADHFATLSRSSRDKSLIKEELRSRSKFVRKLDDRVFFEFDWNTFLAEAVFMFLGIEYLLESQRIHHDVKPHNILYNIDAKRMSLIDFGLIKTFDRVSERLNVSNLSTTFHFSYPIEYFFMKRDEFSEVCGNGGSSSGSGSGSSGAVSPASAPAPLYGGGQHASVMHCDHVKWQLPSHVHLDNDIKADFQRAMGLFTHYSDCTAAHCNRLQADLNQFFQDLKGATVDRDYASLVDKFCKCFDSYGLGFSLQYVIVSARRFFPNTQLYDELYELFYSMYTPNLFHRLDIFAARIKYCQILDKYNIPYKLTRDQTKTNNHHVATTRKRTNKKKKGTAAAAAAAPPRRRGKKKSVGKNKKKPAAKKKSVGKMKNRKPAKKTNKKTLKTRSKR